MLWMKRKDGYRSGKMSKINAASNITKVLKICPRWNLS
jgi:hypothetical protein